jgi:hypothetical protein
MATLRGEPVDRPAVNFYEIGGFDVDPGDPDEFNIYNDPSWRPLLELAEQHTDLIRMRHPALTPAAGNPRDDFFHTETYVEGRSRCWRTTLSVAGREMTSLSRRDPEMDTTWHLERPLKDAADLEAYLELPDEVFAYDIDVAGLEAADEEVGDRGIVMADTGDPICQAAELFSMEDFTVVALTEQRPFHRLLEKLAAPIWARTEKVSAAFPGHLWRICGAEYATEPYLPPRLFGEYVARYTAPMIESIHRHGGFARLHCHGRIRSALPHIVAMGAAATDPIEPPPLGDVELGDVRREYGRQLVLFGNIEIRDIENLPPAEFESLVAKSLADGTAGEGRGFVLMPTACPCGRTITPRTMANYETMVRLAAGAA